MFDIEAAAAKQHEILERVKSLELIGFQMAELARIKESLEQQVKDLIGHEDEGQRTYIYDRYKVTVKTGMNYSLNKEEYEAIGSRLPLEFQPVVEVTKYELNKKIIRQAYIYGSKEDKEILDAIIVAKPAKLNIVIGSAS